MTISPRNTMIVANWKMYKTIEEADTFIAALVPLVKESAVDILLAVPFTAIKTSAEKCKETNITIGAQNMNDASEGAFTGEIAANMLLDAGAKFVILGHSERRTLFGETNQFINKKVKKALEEGLLSILCIGENKQDYEENKTQDVLKKQLLECLGAVELNAPESLVIAYEPVWAIGTGTTPTPEEIQKIHTVCRELLSEIFNEEVSKKILIIYGGSVNPSNAGQILKENDVDGFLVGGASLSPDSFSQIVHYQNALTF